MHSYRESVGRGKGRCGKECIVPNNSTVLSKDLPMLQQRLQLEMIGNVCHT